MTTPIDRRNFLNWGLQGLGATALVSLLQSDGMLAQTNDNPLATFPNFPARAKRAVHICLVGGMSQVDSFDYKPALARLHGRSLQSSEQPDAFFGQVGLLRKPDWQFRQRGESGLWLSDLFPNIAEHADDLTVIRSMVSDSANHTPALFFANSGFQFNGFPSLGSWLSFGLGRESESLPAFVVLPDGRGAPNGGSSNWTSGFLPAQNQGVFLRPGAQPVRDLFPAQTVEQRTDTATREFLQQLNHMHRQEFGDEPILTARIRSYELAARMQQSIPEVNDLSQETRQTQEMYGMGNNITADCGRRCLLARRMLERGVRFVQIYSGGPIAGNPRSSWDAHENVLQNHGAEAQRIDKPVAALLQDLKLRGLLDDTLVLFTTEFGRTPFTQSARNVVGTGRDHNRHAFSVWLAGAGVKPGLSYGATDEIGWRSEENVVSWHDFHATILHLFGIDHTRLTYYHNGIARRLTNVHGEVIEGILA